MTTRAPSRRNRGHSSWRFAGPSFELRIRNSRRRAGGGRRRRCGVSAIPGTSTSADIPARSAAETARTGTPLVCGCPSRRAYAEAATRHTVRHPPLDIGESGPPLARAWVEGGNARPTEAMSPTGGRAGSPSRTSGEPRASAALACPPPDAAPRLGDRELVAIRESSSRRPWAIARSPPFSPARAAATRRP